MCKVGLNVLKKTRKEPFKFVQVVTYCYSKRYLDRNTLMKSLYKYINVLYMQLKSFETLFGQFKVRKHSPNWFKTHLEQLECV